MIEMPEHYKIMNDFLKKGFGVIEASNEAFKKVTKRKKRRRKLRRKND
jgi:hypothetical protein